MGGRACERKGSREVACVCSQTEKDDLSRRPAGRTEGSLEHDGSEARDSPERGGCLKEVHLVLTDVDQSAGERWYFYAADQSSDHYT